MPPIVIVGIHRDAVRQAALDAFEGPRTRASASTARAILANVSAEGKSKPEPLREELVAGRLAQQFGQQTLSTCAERVRVSVQTIGRSGMPNSSHILLVLSTDDTSVIAFRGGP